MVVDRRWFGTSSIFGLCQSHLLKINQMLLHGSDGREIPDSALSRQNGTNTGSSSLSPKGGESRELLLAFRYRHTPLRFFQLERCRRGRGYSGHGFSPTVSVQFVFSGVKPTL